MFCLPKTLTLMLLMLLLLTHHVTCNPPFIGKSPVESVMVSMLKIQQVKERILRGLNMTSAPHKSPTTRMLTPESSKVKIKRPFDSVERQPNISMILSESADDGQLDTMSFKLDSRTRAHVQNLEIAILVVRLRSYHDQMKRDLQNQTDSGQESRTGSWADSAGSFQTMWTTPETVEGTGNRINVGPKDGKQRWKNKRVVKYEAKYSANTLFDKLEFYRNSTPATVGDESTISLRMENLKQLRQGKIRKMPRLKPRRVKVVIKAIDPVTGKKRRIAVEKVSVKRTSTMAVPVSKEVLVAAAASSNHSLLLQMTCKRCKGRVQIEQVYKTVARRNKKHRKKTGINPNRPYLFIRTGSSPAGEVVSESEKLESPNLILRSRSKRRSVSDKPVEFLPSRNITDNIFLSPNTCCSQKMDVSFQELDLQYIIYPKSLSVSFCLSPCRADNSVHLKSNVLYHQKEQILKEWYTVFAKGKLDCKFENIFSLASVSSSSLNVIHKNIVSKKTWSSSESSRVNSQCMLLLVDPMNVVFLDEPNHILARDLNEVAYEFCDCNGRR